LPIGLPKGRTRLASPLNYAGLGIWLKPESLGASGDILTWADSSGNSNDATWSTGDKFQVATGVLDGFKAARASDAGLERLDLTSGIETNTGDIWLILDSKGAGSEDQQVISGFDGAQNGLFIGTGSTWAWRDSGGITVTYTYSTGMQVLRIKWGPANGTNQWFEIGGVDVHNRTSITITPLLNMIGSQLSAWEWYGDLVEIFMYVGQTRTDADATNLYNNYLKKKFPSLSVTR